MNKCISYSNKILCANTNSGLPNLLLSSCVCSLVGDVCILWGIIHTLRQDKVLRKKKQQNKTIFSAVCDIFLFTLLWYFDWRKQIFSMNLVTTKHSQVLDASTKSMRSLNDSQLFCLMLDMDHKVLLRVLSLPVQWLKS